MGIVSKLFEDYLVAPQRYIDQKGYNPHSSGLPKLLSHPASKLCAIGGLIGAFAIAASDEKKEGTVMLAGALLCAAAIHIGEKTFPSSVTYYFDTQPDRPQQKIEPAVRRHLEGRRNIMLGSMIYTPLFTGTQYVMFKTIANPDIALGVCLIYGTTTIGSDFIATIRAKKALLGEWNVSTSKPEKEAAPALSPAPQFTAT